MSQAPFTEATTAYWQEALPADRAPSSEPPWRYGYPARLPDGRVLVLPIRALASEPTHAVASLILNQAALDVAKRERLDVAVCDIALWDGDGCDLLRELLKLQTLKAIQVACYKIVPYKIQQDQGAKDSWQIRQSFG